MKNNYDVVIIGAGPGGLQAAKFLAQNGKNILVIEKNKTIIEKTCGGLMSIRALKFNIPDEIIEKKYNNMFIITQRKKEVIKQKKPFVFIVSRKELGKWQKKETEKACAEILMNCNALQINENDIITNNGTFGFEYLIGADGANSIVRKSLNIITDELLLAFHYRIPGKFKNIEFFVDPSRFKGFTYFWIIPHKNHASIGTGIDVGKSIKLDHIKGELIKWIQEKGLSIKNAKFEAAPINYDFEGFKFKNKYLIGDAAGLTSGIYGEGIYSAMLSGEEVAKKILNKNYDMKELYSYIRKINYHENLLRTLEINEISAEIIFELLVSALRSKFIADKFIEFFIK